ncbi:MAG: DUF4193 family protein [Solirubrobacterales bacterium]
MEDIEDTLEDEELDDGVAEPEEVEGASPAPRAAAGEEAVESIQDLLVKQEAREGEEEETEDSVLTLTRDELRDESLAVKVVPPQPNEFTCRKCYLVKHRSQLKDKAKMLCRDCA